MSSQAPDWTQNLDSSVSDLVSFLPWNQFKKLNFLLTVRRFSNRLFLNHLFLTRQRMAELMTSPATRVTEPILTPNPNRFVICEWLFSFLGGVDQKPPKIRGHHHSSTTFLTIPSFTLLSSLYPPQSVPIKYERVSRHYIVSLTRPIQTGS